MVLFMVTRNIREGKKDRVITMAHNREDAKRRARDWLSGDPDQYEVTPLSEEGDRVKVEIANC